MALNTILSIGLCILLSVCTINSLTSEFNINDNSNLGSPCIVNVTNPNCTRCQKGTYAPYPNDPTMFYQCSNGEFYPKHCEPNTEWNETVHTCINENNSDLGSICIVNVTNPNCTRCQKGTYAPYPNDPTMFYQCSNGEFYPRHCEPNTEWNETVHTCINEKATTITIPYDSKTVTSTFSTISSSTKPFQTTPQVNFGSFNAASFGGGIGAGLGISLLVLLLIRCCCSSSERNGYEHHI